MASMVAMLVTNASSMAQSAAKTKSEGGSHGVVRTDSKGRKYVNKIPYDVFFVDPLQLATQKQPAVESTSDVSSPSVAKTSVKPPLPVGNEESGNGPASDAVPIEELQSEVKAIRNRLTSGLTSPAQFRQNVKSISNDGQELAALSIIVQNHGQSLSWKDKSQYVREFGTQIGSFAVGLGKEDFEKTRAAFQKLTSVLDGSIPPDVGDVPETRPLHEAASRKALMKRIEKAKDWLKQEINSEAKFKSSSAQILHESVIIEALAKVIATPGYDYTENADYQLYAKSLFEGAQEAADASAGGAFQKFKSSIDKINKSCTDCHGTYGNG